MHWLDYRKSAAILTGALILIAGCSGSQEKTSAGPSAIVPPITAATKAEVLKTKIAVGGISALIYLPVALADQAGYYTAAGLDVVSSNVPGGADAAKALISGEVDFAGMALEHVVKNRIAGADLVMVHLFVNQPGMALVVDSRYKDSIKTVADLKGKKVGVSSPGSGTHGLLLKIASTNNMGESDFDVRGVGIATMPEKMAADEVVAAIGLDPQVTQLVQSNKAYILYDLRTAKETERLYGSDYPFVGLVTRRDVIQKKPETVKRMIEAVSKAQQFLLSSDPSTTAGKLPANFKGSDEQLYVESLRNTIPIFSPDGTVSSNGLNTVVQAMKDQKAIPEGTKVELADVFAKP